MHCAVEEASYPEQPNEALGRFVGIADVVGASVTFKMLTEEMKIIIRSTVRTATKEGAHKNRRAENHAPTLTPKPNDTNLKIGEQVEGITTSSIPDDIDHGTKCKEKSRRKNGEDALDQVDAESDPKLKRKKKPPDPNTDPSLAQPTFCTSAMEDAVRNGGELPTIDISDIIFQLQRVTVD